jgi:MoxR-like ATPase
MTQANLDRQIDDFRRDYLAIAQQVRSVIVGLDTVVEQVLTCLLAGGHALLEGVPGLGKTLLVRTLAGALDLRFGRIQFTPDLMPADIMGTMILQTGEDGAKAFVFQQGPLFANLVLADEINRATPKTQSAVLEAMQEQTVSVARVTHRLPSPFFVLATQNPLEMEGTYPLPEAQLDRFMFKIAVASPSRAELVSILQRTTGPELAAVRPAASAERLEQMKSLVRQIPAASHVMEYIARLVRATHPGADEADDYAHRYIRYGASPRAAQAMLLAAKVSSVRDGRANVAFDDVLAAALPSLRHRLILSFEAQADGIAPDAVVARVLERVGR